MGQPRNCLIFGTGRSGTTALTGCLARSGYFVGRNLLSATSQMPDGYYEDAEINGLNDWIIGHTYGIYRGLYQDTIPPKLLFSAHIGTPCFPQPFAIKDPRFTYTYPVWKEKLPPHVCIVLLRPKDEFVESLLRLRADHPSIPDNTTFLGEVWENMMEHLTKLNYCPDVHFFTYKRIVSGEAFPDIEKVLECKIDTSFVREHWQRWAEQQPRPVDWSKVPFWTETDPRIKRD